MVSGERKVGRRIRAIKNKWKRSTTGEVDRILARCMENEEDFEPRWKSP
jgi:hypothetical protein